MPLKRRFPSNFPAVTPLLILAASVCLFSVTGASASSGWSGYTGSDPVLSLAATPVEIRIDAPTPLTGNNLQLLLALSGGDGGLGDMRKKASQEFSDYLNQQVQRRFGEFFDDERVRLVDAGAALTLHTNFSVTIRQKIIDIVSGKDYDLEKGIMTAYGEFRYRIQGTALGAHALREGSVDIARLNLEARYLTRAPTDGGVVEDTTRQATERLLEDIAEEVLDQIEDVLEADALLDLARR